MLVDSERHFCWVCMGAYHLSRALLRLIQWLHRSMANHCFYDLEVP